MAVNTCQNPLDCMLKIGNILLWLIIPLIILTLKKKKKALLMLCSVPPCCELSVEGRDKPVNPLQNNKERNLTLEAQLTLRAGQLIPCRGISFSLV